MYLGADYVGSGIKRTHAYKSKLPLEEVHRKRVEFWGNIEGSGLNNSF